MSVVRQRKAIAQPRRGIRGGDWLPSVCDLDDVEDGEEEDPDDIDEMPIETDIIKRGSAPRSIISGEKLTEKAPQDEQDANKHVRAVESSHHEKAGTVNAMFVEPEPFMMEVLPLPGLHRQEDRTGDDGGKKPDKSRLSLLFDRGFRAMEQEAAADKNNCISDHDQI